MGRVRHARPTLHRPSRVSGVTALTLLSDFAVAELFTFACAALSLIVGLLVTAHAFDE